MPRGEAGLAPCYRRIERRTFRHQLRWRPPAGSRPLPSPCFASRSERSGALARPGDFL